MKITWYGHAAFLIEAEGKRIILDPYKYPDAGGYLPIDEPADAVVVSHENDRYHSHVGQIVPPFQLVKALELPPEGGTAAGIGFQAIHVYENPQKLPEDEVTVYHFRADGLHVVFLGDLGHSLEPEEVAGLRNCDILLAAAGGPPTIDFPLMPELVRSIKPRVIIPMHYKTPRINLNIQPVERFFETLSDWKVEIRDSATFEVTRETMPAEPVIISLKHCR